MKRKGPAGVGRNGQRNDETAKVEKDRNEDQSFDLWLERQLRDLYDPVLSDPIPDKLLDLIETHRSKKKH